MAWSGVPVGRARAAVSLVGAVALVACGRSCGEGSVPGTAERDLGQLTVGAATVTLRAKLVGRLEQTPIGGGRLRTRVVTGAESWRIEVEAATPDGRDVIARGEALWIGDDRAAGQAVLDALTLERCASGPVSVHRVRGASAAGWHVAHSAPGLVVIGAVDRAAESCADVAANAPSAEAVLASYEADGLSALADLAHRRQTEPGVGIDSAGGERTRLAERACGAMLSWGHARAAVECVLALGVLANEPTVAAVVAAIERQPDVEEALFEAVALGAERPARAPAVQEISAAGFARSAPTLLGHARTASRMRAFVEAQLDGCGAEGTACEPWRLEALGSVATAAGDGALCDRAHRFAAEILGRPDGPARALDLLRPSLTCGDPEVTREVLVSALDRSTTAGAQRDCADQAGDCGSLPRLSGRWLARHCHSTAVEKAASILPGLLASRPRASPYTDGDLDGPFRVLRACGPDRLTRILEATGRTDLAGSAR